LLQEQADAAGDSKTKTGLQQEAAAAADAGKKERDALQMELQRTNAQAPAISRKFPRNSRMPRRSWKRRFPI
jgi:hypothetical protein